MHADPTASCRIYRCSAQDQMYLYVREDYPIDELPPALRGRLGQITEVMTLELTADRRLARADTRAVIGQLIDQGWYLQMPPNGQVQANLYFGD